MMLSSLNTTLIPIDTQTNLVIRKINNKRFVIDKIYNANFLKICVII